MSGTDRDLLLYIIEPTLALMSSIIGQVIEVRGNNYHDTSALNPLFRTFTVICSVPVGPMDARIVAQVSFTFIFSWFVYHCLDYVRDQSTHNPSSFLYC